MASLATYTRPPPCVTQLRKHPHSLTLVGTDHAKFECSGCHEHGTGGNKYTCPQPGCCFNLHEDCALTQPGARFDHPLLKGATLEFCLDAPSSKEERRLCDACGDTVLGFHYHCNKGLDLHPCCAKLPLMIQKEELTFELQEKVSHRCTECGTGGGVRDFWFYRSACKTVYLHVRCVKQVSQLSSSSSPGPDAHDDGGLVRYVKATALQKHGPGKAGRKFDAIFAIVKAVVSVIFAVITGNPLPLITVGFDVARSCLKIR